MRPSNGSRMLQDALGVILLVIAFVRPASAQARFASTPGPTYALFRPAPTAPPARPEGFIHSSAPDYRWEGLVIGGLIGGTLAAFLVSQSGDGGTCSGCVGEAVGVTALGAAAGGLIGMFAGLVTAKNTSPRPDERTTQ